jgi:hypothetical protein
MGLKRHAIGNIFGNTFNTLQVALRTFGEHIGNNKAPQQSNSPHPLSQKGFFSFKKTLSLFNALLHCLIAWAKFLLLHLFVTLLDVG